MSEHQQSGAFLKALVMHLGSDEHRQLHDDLIKAERDERCLCRATFLALLLLMLAGAGLVYCALLLPDIYHNPTHLLMRSLYVLALGSLISQTVFLGYLLWHRTVVTRLHRECRRQVLALARSQYKLPAIPRLIVPEGKVL